MRAPAERDGLDPPPAWLTLATYNVHACVGTDGRRDVERVVAVLREIDADVIALQEVLSGPPRDQLTQLAAGVRMTPVFAAARPDRRGTGSDYGNALLCRAPVSGWATIDLSIPPFEPRCAIAADLHIGPEVWLLLVTHFGLRLGERHRQLDRLEVPLSLSERRPVALLGDLNAWLPGRDVVGRLARRFGPQPALRTYPSQRPLLPLDRIVVSDPHRVGRTWVHASATARAASDHLPLCARVRLVPDGGTSAARAFPRTDPRPNTGSR